MISQLYVYYDSHCGFCQSCVHFLQRRDGTQNLLFHPLNSSHAKKHIPVHIQKVDSLIVSQNGIYYMYSNAVLKSIIGLGGLYKLFVIGFVIPKFLRDFLYKQIAKRRNKSCIINS